MGTYIAHKDRPGTHIQMTRVKNCFGVRADRYAIQRDACAAARLGNDSFVGAVLADEPSGRSNTSYLHRPMWDELAAVDLSDLQRTHV